MPRALHPCIAYLGCALTLIFFSLAITSTASSTSVSVPIVILRNAWVCVQEGLGVAMQSKLMQMFSLQVAWNSSGTVLQKEKNNIILCLRLGSMLCPPTNSDSPLLQGRPPLAESVQFALAREEMHQPLPYSPKQLVIPRPSHLQPPPLRTQSNPPS